MEKWQEEMLDNLESETALLQEIYHTETDKSYTDKLPQSINTIIDNSKRYRQ